MVVALILIAPRPSAARTQQERQLLGMVTGTPVDSTKAHAFTLADDQIPAWLRALLARQSGKFGEDDFPRTQTLVFHQGGKPTYVAATWNYSYSEGALTIHRVDPGERLTLVRLINDRGGESIVKPSGDDVTPNHVALLLVEESSGGTHYDGYFVRILSMTNIFRDITPPLRTVWAERIGNDFIAMSVDERWPYPFDSGPPYTTLIPVISIWKENRFVPACRLRPDEIENSLRRTRKRLAAKVTRKKGYGPDHMAIATAKVEIFLTLLQLGRAREGYAAYQNALATVDHFIAGSTDKHHADLYRQWRRTLLTEFAPVVRRAMRARHEQCPLTASGKDGWR